MKRKTAVMFAVLATLAVSLGTSASARVAAPCTAANGSPISKSLSICVGQIAFFKGKPGTNVRVTIMLASMTGHPVTNVRVVDILPKGVKPLSSNRPYKLVNGRPTWVVRSVSNLQFYRFTARTPANAKPGSHWNNVVTAGPVGGKMSRSGPALVQYLPSN
jgi:uncharacterized repeat protein (TIGR01451 family)